MNENKAIGHPILTGLIYPAILGALMYDWLKSIYCAESLFSERNFLILSLLVHYTMDFVYTFQGKAREGYTFFKFLLDFLVVIFLYFAIHPFLDTKDVSPITLSMLGSVGMWLFITKICALLWEFSEIERGNWCQPEKWLTSKPFEIKTDFYFLNMYALFWIGASCFDTKELSFMVVLLSMIVLGDALLYACAIKKRAQ